MLDKYLQVLPVKIPGELCIGGIGVSKGYYQNKELTEEKFIDTPYLSEKRIYRTGDLTRWLPDGNIEFLGRIDQQVKIRGLRIELGEIESQLLKHKAIKEAVVIARKSENGENYLCAYLVAGEKGAVEISILRDYLRELLPGYMVPSYFVFLESMPLTPSGKIDRRGFPEPQIDVEKNYVGPRDRIEESLIKIWCEVLDKKGLRIGIDDHFFQLGGHSLKATALVSRIIKEFNVKIPLEKVFKKPTIRGLSVYIKEAVGEEYKAIEPVEKKDYYVLSSAQKRLYFLQQMDSGGRGTTYNISAAWVLEGVMDTGLFEQVFTRLIQRHESLRTYFVMIGEEPVQRIINKSFAELFQKRLFNKIKDFIQPFDLSSAPLLRVGLNKIEENKHILVVDMHHIISDGISTEILVREFSALYQKKGLLEINLQYKDYAEWQKGLKIGESLLSQGTYWRNEFAGDIPVLDLPLDYTRPTVQDFEGAERTFFISPEMTGSLNGLAFETGTTLYMVLLAIYNIFLARLSSQEDIVVGSPVAGRRHEELEKIIGMFVNTLALRNFPVSDKSFTYFLAEVKEKTLAAFENQEYQYEDLVEQVAVNRDTGHNPLFDTMIVLQNTGSSELNIPGLKIDTCVSENKTAKFDLTLVAVEGENKLNFIFEYSVKLFKEETIKRFTAYFINIINGVIADKNQKISEFEIITDAEKQQILYEFNNTEKEYPRNKSIVQLFAEQVEQIPDYIALHGCMIAWMDGCMDAWMHDCMDGEVARNIVGIMIDRSLDVIIGILGILKSGGAYLPIDPEYPQERIDYMLNDSQARLTINYEFLKDAPQAPFLQHSAFIVQHSNHLAYIIYTSGSTGKPKGVLIEQHAVLNLLFSMQNKYPFNTGDTYLFKTSYNFDVSVTELFGWFMGGGKLAILEKNGEKDPQVIMDWIERFQVTHINFVPSMFNAFITQLNKKNIKRLLSLKYIFLAGEVLLPEFVQTFRALDTKIKLENIYGPTENTVYSSWYSLADWNGTGNIPIGKLLPNVKLYILNTHNHLQPLGIPGELCISGTGLARGYLNNPELSAEKFIFSPNFLTSSPPKFPLYRTGDLARWLPDGPPAGGDSGGVIEFMGRIDHQVKIRGFRIELGEIENRLLKHPDVKEAVVLVQEESGDKSLCAYIVSIDEKVISGLKEYLSKELPDYMIPSYFLHLEKIPLTPNGKIDRKALPKPGLKAGDIYTAPRDETEKKLVELWAGILSRDEVHASQLKASIGIDDNFFQLGGHSLKATNLVSAIHKSLNVQVLLAEVFKRPTIRGLAGYIKGKVEEQYQAIEPVEKKENYELSSAQKRLFFLSQLDPEGMAYNIPIIIPLPGDFQIEKLSDVFKKLIKRHDSLRTSFHLLNNGPVQKIHEEVEFEIATDACGVHGQTRPPGGSLLKFLQQFDLSRAPLMRAGLLKNNDGSYILLVDIHHIVTDGTSQEVLKNDFMSLYKGEALPSLPLQYKDFAQWQNSNKENDRFKQQELYWLNEFPDEIPVLAIPTDYPRPLMQSFAGNNINFEIAARETGLLHDLVLQSGATLFMVLAAVLNILLAKLSGQEDIVIGTPVAGRRHADLEKIIGMFVNTLALRNYPVGKRTFREFLDLLKDRTLAAFENQEYPFDDLVEKVSITRDMGRNPLFDVLFVLQNISSVPGIPAEAVPGRRTFEDDNITDITRTTKFDLEITAWEAGQRLELDFGYGTKLFKKETIERFITYFKRIVSLVVKAKESSIRICDIEIITEEEKAQILFEFNDTAIEYPEDKTIHQLFAEQAAQTPDYIALHGCMSAWMDGCMDAWMHDCMDGEVASNVSLTYRQLNEQSDRLAGLLMEKGVLPDTIVAIMIERSIEMIIGILGILKSGGAYLPIDPGYPQERIDYMLKDSATSILLTNEKKKDNCQCSIVNCQLSMIERPRRGIQHSIFHAFDISRIQHSNHLCYIIYTSGSTGKPKGVMVEHKNLVHYLYAFTHEFNINACDTVLQQASYCFDVFAEEVYPVLLAGGRIAVPTKNQVLDINFLSIFILKNKITIVDCSPLLLNELDKKAPPLALQGIRIFISGGDVLKGEYVANLIKNRTVYNTYGPTETTICATYYKCPNVSLSDVPIGKPIAYYFVPILSENDHLVPIGVAGELCVAGPGVTRGYLNRPELTHEKFKIINYKLKIINGSGTLRADLNAFGDEENFQYSAFITQHSNFYSTGDLARWLPDGNIQFLGRIDQQVKIRGFRIELGEIESQLVKHEHIKDIVVVLKENGIGDKNLAAYYVADIELPPTELREYLLKNLPVYMIPTHFMRLEKIPVTSSGKVDRRALPMPQLSEMPQCTAPRNSIEMKLAKIWAEVLNIDSANHQIGIDDHFFHLGGHSLKATSLAARIYKEFNVKIPLKEFFQRSTIRQMAIYIKEAGKEEFAAVSPTEEKEYYPISSAQKRLYFLYQLEPGNITYNMPYMMILGENTVKEKLEEIFKELIARHESLRTSFETINMEPVQVIHKKIAFSILQSNVEEKDAEEIIAGLTVPFDLRQAPLLRVHYLTVASHPDHSCSPCRRMLFIDMHHIITDGTSQDTLAKEFALLAKGISLLPLALQYKDYSEWQRSTARQEALKEQEIYWLNEFAGELPVLQLPTDFPRPIEQTSSGNVVMFKLNALETAALKAMAKENDVTLYMALLAIFTILLAKLSGQDDIIVGTPIAARQHPDLQPVIGMFVNTLAMRNNPTGEKTFKLYLQEVKLRTLEAYENQDYPFEELVDHILVERDIGRNPVFDVLFNFLNENDYLNDQNLLPAEPGKHRKRTAKFDMNWTISEVDSELRVDIEYATKLFKPDSIDRFYSYFKNLVHKLPGEIELKIANIEILGEHEKEEILKLSEGDISPYDPKDTIPGLFADQVNKNPDCIALHGCMIAWMHGCMIAWMDGCMDAWMHDCMDGEVARNVSLTYRP
ncbi:MAG: amino acid adenylation domain-containing protein [Acidobacteria bacterium]|nr:amino acid adenylation domain-containing protein [Acidobacteriota bacterium]